MITLCIRYTLDANKLADFAAYEHGMGTPIERCGGKMIGYYLPTKFAGPTNIALALIDFPSLAAYEHYREKLAADPDAIAMGRRAAESGCIVIEDRSFMQRTSQ
jgi:hypothetical protein